MTPATPTPDEAFRLESLRQYAALDTLPEQALDDLTALAAQICGAPIAMISLVDEHRQWFKSKVGTEVAETARDISFCGHTVQGRDLFIVPDALRDERFADNPLVTESPSIRFYAGAPLVTPENAAIGALCVIDHVPRALAPEQQQALQVLARQVITHLELQRNMRELLKSEDRLQIVTHNARVGLVIVNRERRYLYANNAYAEILDLPSARIIGRAVADVLPAIYEEQIRPRLDQAFAGERVLYELRKPTASGDSHYEVKYEPTTVNGEITMVVVVIMDVTERKRAEMALIESEGNFRLLAEKITDVFWIASHDLEHMHYISPGYERIWGRAVEELYANPHQWAEAIVPEDRARALEVFGTLCHDTPTVSVEYRIARPDGSIRWVHDRGFQIRDGEGKLERLIGIATDITERKQAETTARRLAAIVEFSDDAIIGKDLTGMVTSWNAGAEKVFGYTAAEMVGASITRLIPPERQVEEQDILQRIKDGETVRHFETVRTRNDGRNIDISVTVSPIKNALGQVIGASKVARDITEQKRAEESLKLFRTLIDKSNDAIEVIDAKTGRFIDVNETACRRLGYSHEEMLSLGVPDVESNAWMSDTTWPSIAEDIRKAGSKIIQGNHRRKDGSTFPIEVNAQYIELNRGYIVSVVRDVTERRQAEEKIAEQAAFLDKARDAIVARDLEGNVLFWNNGAERMYGWSSQEVMGRNISGLLYADPTKFTDLNNQTVNQGAWQGEIHQFTKDKRELTVEARWTLIRDNEGRPKSILAINTDITEKKKIEAQFMRAQRMESIGTLAGGVAHDLNNILAPIMMSIDILKTMMDRPQAREILDAVEVSAKRGADIVRQVLSFARGVAGDRVEIQPKHLLKDLEKIIKDTFPKDIQMLFSIPTNTWTIMGDATQVHQILLNLCVNARDAMPNGGKLSIGIENCELDEQYAAMNIQAKPGRYVVISVTDSGMGIPPANLEKIFEPFFTTKELNKGTGLGLSTVMAIVKSHDGIINVYSEPGRGTTFKIYLPAMASSSEGRGEESEQASLPRGKDETVLVIDDEASVLTITGQTLEAFGYRVLTATDGAEGVAIYAQHRDKVSVVLTDMMMPVMDGPATIHALMRINPTLKIVAASGLGANGGVAKVSGAGVKHFLTKPYTAATLLKTLRVILDEK